MISSMPKFNVTNAARPEVVLTTVLSQMTTTRQKQTKKKLPSIGIPALKRSPEMTVSDLIELLQEMPQNAQVLANYDGHMTDSAVFVEVVHAAMDEDGWYRPKVKGYGKDYVYVC
jgi:UDP-N-acetyl-D-mannosaminuronate dehydrogenase